MNRNEIKNQVIGQTCLSCGTKFNKENWEVLEVNDYGFDSEEMAQHGFKVEVIVGCHKCEDDTYFYKN